MSGTWLLGDNVDKFLKQGERIAKALERIAEALEKSNERERERGRYVQGGAWMTRPTWDEYGVALAKTASIRGDCTRRKVGACILGADHRVLGLGYNGYEAGGKSCLKGECPRGRHYQVTGPELRNHYATSIECEGCHNDDCGGCSRTWCGDWVDCPNRECMECETPWPCASKCACGNAWPCFDYTEPGSGYTESGCGAIHAEQNAIGDLRFALQGATMYISEAPCEDCRAMIEDTYIARVVWPGGTWDVHGD